jgi:hypothetical protein
MSDETGFETDYDKLAALVKALGVGGVVDAFPADLLAPTWRALLQAGAIKGPDNVDVSRVVVRLIGSTHDRAARARAVEGRRVVKSVVVFVDQWTASGELGQQLDSEADVLARALDTAYNQQTVDHEGPGPEAPYLGPRVEQ